MSSYFLIVQIEALFTFYNIQTWDQVTSDMIQMHV
jgi:hypothetical protein